MYKWSLIKQHKLRAFCEFDKKNELQKTVTSTGINKINRRAVFKSVYLSHLIPPDFLASSRLKFHNSHPLRTKQQSRNTISSVSSNINILKAAALQTIAPHAKRSQSDNEHELESRKVARSYTYICTSQTRLTHAGTHLSTDIMQRLRMLAVQLSTSKLTQISHMVGPNDQLPFIS